MPIKFTILGCGSSLGVPRADGNWGKCNPKEKKNYRTRCSAMISNKNFTILFDTSPDLRTQLIKNKIRSEMKKGLLKDKIINDEDKILFYDFYQKITNEFSEIEKQLSL